ncbi:MAG TPA: hypothetical protein VMW36_10705 [Patescibacteria group bacterium]|nr:hypothetical protein [Patescibacteria group bacterium]
MIPEIDRKTGYLPAGIHTGTWHELAAVFGFNEYRRELLSGLLKAARELRGSGCNVIYLDGSFVSLKEYPGDYDGCWEMNNVHMSTLDPVLIDRNDLRKGRLRQKLKYKGELFPGKEGWLDFFQTDKDGVRKGVIVLDLRSLPR